MKKILNIKVMQNANICSKLTGFFDEHGDVKIINKETTGKNMMLPLPINISCKDLDSYIGYVNEKNELYKYDGTYVGILEDYTTNPNDNKYSKQIAIGKFLMLKPNPDYDFNWNNIIY